jgi:hypothetical protein
MQIYQLGKGTVLGILAECGVKMRGQGIPEDRLNQGIDLHRVAGRWCAWATTSAAAVSGIEDGIELAQVARADFRAAMQLSARRGHQARIHAARRRLRSMTWLPTTEPVPRTPDSSRAAAWARAQRSRDDPW